MLLTEPKTKSLPLCVWPHMGGGGIVDSQAEAVKQIFFYAKFQVTEKAGFNISFSLIL